ncbi:MAG: hypothetical protein Q9162_004400 [Coniocarpon cinnabarinum]
MSTPQTVPIQPKPGHELDNAGVASQMATNTRHLRPTTSQGKPQFLSWDLKAGTGRSDSVSQEHCDSRNDRRDQDLQPIQVANSARKVKAMSPPIRLLNHDMTTQYNNLGLDADPHVKTLLHWFIKGGPGDYQSAGGRLATCNRLAFPMIAQSAAALSSLGEKDAHEYNRR